MRDVLNRLESVVEKVSTVLPPDIRPPATDESIRKLADFLRFDSLPEQVIQLYKWHDGGGGELWFGGGGFWTFISIDSAMKLMSEWEKCSLDLVSGTDSSKIHLPEEKGWPRTWIPFADWNSDVFLVVDATMDSELKVLGVDIEGSKIVDISPSLKDFFQFVLAVRSEGSELDIDRLMD